MAKFRKKPIVIEAWQWLFNDKQESEPSWIIDAMHRWPEKNALAFEPDYADGSRICISTLEGVMVANPGDWIIKGIKDELYPCKPDIFEATYEKVA